MDYMDIFIPMLSVACHIHYWRFIAYEIQDGISTSNTHREDKYTQTGVSFWETLL